MKLNKNAVKALCINWLIAFVAFVPFIMRSNGLFSLSNDFDAQELAFNMFVNREIKAGNIFYNWSIDLGSDFVGSFSFYNLGSPFLWLTLVFPPAMFPYLVGWIYMLKYAVAGWSAYLYLEQYVEKKDCAIIGSVLYAFSGYQAANLVFYHFHDVVAFFPLLLLGIDKAVEKKEKGRMAAAVFINALVNWNFFYGEVVFSILYYIVRYAVFHQLRVGEWKTVIKQSAVCMIEGMIGIGMSAVLFIPSVYSIINNDRLSNHIKGADALVFSTQDYLQLIKALLLPNETLCNQSVLSAENWYSIAAYLPLVSIIFVAVSMKCDKESWVSKLLKISLIFAVVPVLNNIFCSLNAEPYRRWYYMPIFIMVLATVKTLDRIPTEQQMREKSILWAYCILAVIFGLFIYLMYFRWSDMRESAINHYKVFLVYNALGLTGILATIYLIKNLYVWRYFYQAFLVAVGIVGCLNIMFNIVRYHQHADYQSTQDVYNDIVKSTEPLQSDIIPYRYAMNNPYYNRNLANSLTSKDSFISTVDAGIFEFYDSIRCHRHNMTNPGPDGTIELLSGKYYVQDVQWEHENPYKVIDNGSRNIYIYEDKNALPIGFTYDSYITKSEFDTLPSEIMSWVMMRTLVVQDEDAERVSNILNHYDLNGADAFSIENKHRDILNHHKESSVEFEHSTKHFLSVIYADAEKYAFFSVPYSNRWSASVNGNNAHILNVNGLMAVPVERGKNIIEFHYDTTINKVGMAVSLLSVLLYIIWRAVMSKKLVHDVEESHVANIVHNHTLL